MRQDVEANKPLEIDALVGAVRELGQITGTPTPHTDALQALTRLMVPTRNLYCQPSNQIGLQRLSIKRQQLLNL